MANTGPSIQGMSRNRIIFPTHVPPDIQALVKATSSMDKGLFRKLIKLSLTYLQKTLSESEFRTAFSRLCEAYLCSTKDQIQMLSEQYAGVISLLLAAFKINMATTRQETLMADLLDIGLPNDFALDICKVVFGPARSDIDMGLAASTPHLPSLVEFDWRVEVTISSSWLSRVLEPVVLMKCIRSDGSSHTFEVSINKFNLLRYSVAKLLHQMEEIESSVISKK